MMVQHDVSFFMQLDYPITLIPIRDEEGGGWVAEIHELKGCCADGETPEEAIKNLREAKRIWLETAIRRGINIPLPQKQTDYEYSGKFTLRIPKAIHKELAERAYNEGISLNQYVSNLISYHLGKVSLKKEIEEMFSKLFSDLNSEISASIEKLSVERRPQFTSSKTISITYGFDKNNFKMDLIPELNKIWVNNGLNNLGGVKRW